MSSQRETQPWHGTAGGQSDKSYTSGEQGGEFNMTRRDLLKVSAATAATVSSGVAFGAEQHTVTPPPVIAPLRLKINGKVEQLDVDTRTTLLDALREHLHLTGTKKGCDHGQCGACTVMVNGRRINSCLTLAVMQQDAEVTTIEGLGSAEQLHPMQAAFIRHDGYQCGYCTPGQICSSLAVLEEIQAGIPSHVTADLLAPTQATADEIRERMSGNICRCGAYSNILAAIEEFAGSQKS